MSRNIIVGIGELFVATYPNTLQALGLGSCVGLTLYDPIAKIGGLAHIMLPDSGGNGNDLRGKYADVATVNLLNDMMMLSAKKERIVAKLVGGASMFTLKNDVFRIGEKNVSATKKALKELGIAIVAEEVGGTIGRTATLYTDTGDVEVKAVNKEPKKI